MYSLLAYSSLLASSSLIAYSIVYKNEESIAATNFTTFALYPK